MNFYQHQESARKQTGLLVMYFAAAVILIIIAVNAVCFFTLVQIEQQNLSLVHWLQSPACWITVAVTLSVIIGGSLAKAVQLNSGGSAVALMAGGSYLSPETKDPQKKQLINVVEEMAIASGVCVPQVFILEDEAGINAFVAGTSPNNAALAITQGALDTFSRDELQGVVGHEFSHILNGDMNINIRLISILAGILLIGKIGKSLTRGGSYGHRHHHHSRQKDSDKGWLFGIALMAIGYIGLFFGRLIKAAISRQREFLADASAVQFTRNPYGIGQALFRIQASQNGSQLTTPNAEDMSHLCFSEAIEVKLSGLLATHPPIESRIKAIDPSLPARLRARKNKQQTSPLSQKLVTGNKNKLQQAPTAEGLAFAPLTSQLKNKEQLSSTLKRSIGQPTPDHNDYAQALLSKIPPTLIDTAHNPQDADIIVYILILATMATHGKEALATIKQETTRDKINKIIECYKQLKQHDESIRLPLLTIALQTLSQQPIKETHKLIILMESLINLDSQFTLFEFVVFCVARKQLLPDKKKHRTINRYSIVFKDIQYILAAICATSNKAGKINHGIFHRAYSAFSSTELQPTLASIQQLHSSLEKLSRLSPLLKQPVVDACIDCIVSDNIITLREVELLRAICETLDCPMPPLIPDNP